MIRSQRKKLIKSGHSTAAALTSGYHLAFAIGAALVGCAILVALAVVRPVAMPVHEAQAQDTDSQPAPQPA